MSETMNEISIYMLRSCKVVLRVAVILGVMLLVQSPSDSLAREAANVMATDMEATPLAELQAPYPPSDLIQGIQIDWSTHDRRAPGSDNWAITWADNDHQYTTWGDGGGFGGTNNDGRVSLGVARIEGSTQSYEGINVWGGKNPENPAQFSGKSYGILGIDQKLYMWRCGDASTTSAYEFQELYLSTNHGATWEFTGVRFDSSDFPTGDLGFYCPTFLQFGRDFDGSRDDYVYIYVSDLQTLTWAVHKPGYITLIRVPRERLSDRSYYEYFAGFDLSGNPTWMQEISKREPVYQDVVNGVMKTSLSYNPGLDRYFLITEHTGVSKGNIGIFEAPEPWGPWKTVLFETAFGAGEIDSTTFFWNFSNKWLSPDGKDFTLVFTGTGSNDSWNSVRGTFILKNNPGPGTFADVPTDHPYFSEIETLYQSGYTAGCGTNPLIYCPDQTMNRAESAVFVERGIHGSDVVPLDPPASLFDDLESGNWALKWANGLYEDGFTAGCGTAPLIYCPWQGHTRVEGAVFYLRMLHGNDYVPPDPIGVFSDLPIDHWGTKWAEAAFTAGLIPACKESPLQFCAHGPLDRGLAATMMVRAKNIPLNQPEKP
jgi:hypothetical protein